MTLHRIVDPSRPIAVPPQPLRDESLSLEAKGLLAVICLTLPANGEFDPSDLPKKPLEELRKAGYVE